MRITPYATLLSAVLLAPAGMAQNLLANPDFESGLAGWTTFGNVSAEVSNPPAIVPLSGNQLCKMFGQFTGNFNVTGIFQSFPASPGQSFTLDCWSRHWSGDPLVGVGPPNDNWAVMKMAFFDSLNIEIGGAERTILDGNSPQNTWIDNAPVSGTAPAGTVRVEALVLFLQPGVVGGSAQIEDVVFTGPPAGATYPGTGEDLVLSSAVGGGPLSSGPGNDVKMVPGNSAVEINVSSPGGAFDLKPYSLVAQLFATGFPPVPNALFPEVWLNFSAPIALLVNGNRTSPIGPPLVGPNGGTSTFYLVPPGMTGASLMVQALVFDSSAANGFYAATNAHELVF